EFRRLLGSGGCGLAPGFGLGQCALGRRRKRFFGCFGRRSVSHLAHRRRASAISLSMYSLGIRQALRPPPPPPPPPDPRPPASLRGALAAGKPDPNIWLRMLELKPASRG